ncbi:MAG: hypothetical protein IJS68_00450 [Clostridia bacterium]|nr:hypothetical protein [Clostridia bacterium]
MITELKTQTKLELKQGEYNNVICFVLLTNNENFNLPEGKNSYELDLLGRPMFEFVSRVCPTRPVTIECSEEDNVLSVIKPYLRDKELALVLYGDTPLLTQGNIKNILRFVLDNDLNVCKLSRGYVFRTEYIKRVDEIFAPQTYYFAEEEFTRPNNLVELASISKVLQKKIIEFHMTSGVRFVDVNGVYIESDVSIGAGTVVGNNVTLCGETAIGKNCRIGGNAKIVSSQIGSECAVGSAVIENSAIKDGSVVGNNVSITNKSFVGTMCEIGDGSIISQSSVSQNVKIKEGCLLKNARIYRDSTLYERASVVGKADALSRVLHGAEIGAGAFVGAGVAVKEETQVPDCKVILN